MGAHGDVDDADDAEPTNADANADDDADTAHP